MIIVAAIKVFTKNPAAPLEEVAQAAKVGRTTLHRYFQNREALVVAITADCNERIQQAVVRAKLHEGRGIDALYRLCHELFEVGDLLLLFAQLPQAMPAGMTQSQRVDKQISDAVARGHRDKTLEPSFDVLWIQNLLWTLIYSSWEHMNLAGMKKHDCLSLLLLTFKKAVSA